MRPCALLFPGQGAQYPGMGKALAETFPESREVFAVADRTLGQDLSGLCFAGGAGELALTENTQPAILATSIAALRALEARGMRCVAAGGHSLGEYSAHVAAGTLALADALRCVRLRGRFMQEAVPPDGGAMAAILGLSADAVERVCRECAGEQVVSPANLNAPGQVVIAGHREAVARAVRAAKERGARRAVPLEVSAPFHCSLMEPAARRLEPVLAELAFRDPAFPVYANVDGAPVRKGSRAREALVRQVASPVRWEALAAAMVDAGTEIFLEVGPGRVLAGLMRRIRPQARVVGVEDPEGVAEAIRALEEVS